jgi:hypothetical protein
MALAGALFIALNAVVGFINRSLRAQVSQLLAGPYSSAQMTYDLRRLRLKGLVVRVLRWNTLLPATLCDHAPATVSVHGSAAPDDHGGPLVDRARTLSPS